MGSLTTITIYNDALHAFEEHPEEFAKAVFKGIVLANRSHMEESVPFRGYANYIAVQPTRHADDHTLYLHMDNTVTELNPYSEGFRKLVEGNPGFAQKLIKEATRILKEANQKAKRIHEGGSTRVH